MKKAVLFCSLLMSMVTSTAWAADPKTNLVDHSASGLIDAEAAKKVMADNIPAKVWKLYPASKWAVVSQVQGGLTDAKTCVVTARVMLLPLTPAVKAVMFRPAKTATSFDAVAGSNTEACKAMARDKLKEATVGVVSSLVKS
jgi:hypothetical protein